MSIGHRCTARRARSKERSARSKERSARPRPPSDEQGAVACHRAEAGAISSDEQWRARSVRTSSGGRDQFGGTQRRCGCDSFTRLHGASLSCNVDRRLTQARRGASLIATEFRYVSFCKRRRALAAPLSLARRRVGSGRIRSGRAGPGRAERAGRRDGSSEIRRILADLAPDSTTGRHSV